MKAVLFTLFILASIVGPVTAFAKETFSVAPELKVLTACQLLVNRTSQLNEGITWKNISEEINWCISTKNENRTLQGVNDLKRSIELIYIFVGKEGEVSDKVGYFLQGMDIKKARMQLGIYESSLRTLEKEIKNNK